MRPEVVEKDYVLGWLLAAIAQHPVAAVTWVIDVNYSCRSATTILAGRATRVVGRPPRPSGGRRERQVEQSRAGVHLAFPFECLV